MTLGLNLGFTRYVVYASPWVGQIFFNVNEEC